MPTKQPAPNDKQAPAPQHEMAAAYDRILFTHLIESKIMTPASSQNIFRAATILACLGSLAACQPNDRFQVGQIVGGATKQVRDVQPVGGFLPDPSLLSPGDPGYAALVYRNPGADLGSYRSIMIAPVTVWTGPDSQVATVPQAQLQGMADQFSRDLYQTLGTSCHLTRRGGPETAVIHIALVDATTTRAGLNTIATYTPYLSTAYSAASLVFNKGIAYLAGSATIEAYVVDASNGTVLWEAVDKRAGTTSMLQNTLNTQLDVDNAFKAWSKVFLSRLQQLGVCAG